MMVKCVYRISAVDTDFHYSHIMKDQVPLMLVSYAVSSAPVCYRVWLGRDRVKVV